MEPMNQPPQISMDTSSGARLPSHPPPKVSWGARLAQVFTSERMSGKNDLKNEAEKITSFVSQALSETSSPKDSNAATKKLIELVQKLQRQEKTASPEERKRIADTLAHAKASMMTIFIAQTPPKMSGQGVERAPHMMQEKYGEALAEGILSKATSEQEVMDLFILQATELQNTTEALAPNIISGMIEAIGKKYSGGLAENLLITLSLISQGGSDDEEKQNVFVLTAKECPQLGMLALEQIGKTNPSALERLRSACQKAGWKEGMTFFRIREITTCFEEGRIDFEATKKLVDLLCERALGKTPHDFRNSVQQLMRAMLRYCDKERAKSPQKPTMEFVYKNWEAIAKTIILAEAGLEGGESQRLLDGSADLKAWLLRSSEIWTEGTKEEFHVEAPPKREATINEAIDDEFKKPRSEEDKKLISTWFPAFRSPHDPVADLLRQGAYFTDPNHPEITIATMPSLMKQYGTESLATCHFAQAIFDTLPQEKRIPEMREVIGTACLAVTQGFAPGSIGVGGVATLQFKLGVPYLYEGEGADGSVQVTIDPKKGVCRAEFYTKGVFRNPDNPIEIVGKCRFLNKVEVRQGDDTIHFTFQCVELRNNPTPNLPS